MKPQIIEIHKDIESGQHFMIWSNGINKPVRISISEADAGTLILNNNFDKEFTETLEKWIFRENTHIKQGISDMENGRVEELKKEDIHKFLGL